MKTNQEMTRWTCWADMPDEMDVDELMRHPLYKNYADNGYAWQVLLTNGVFYTGTIPETIGKKCQSDSRLDPITI